MLWAIYSIALNALSHPSNAIGIFTYSCHADAAFEAVGAAYFLEALNAFAFVDAVKALYPVAALIFIFEAV
jgi:hypothetical protein